MLRRRSCQLNFVTRLLTFGTECLLMFPPERGVCRPRLLGYLLPEGSTRIDVFHHYIVSFVDTYYNDMYV